jgi:protein-L-isoaspartate(D-aspartate) O-methyltransferase
MIDFELERKKLVEYISGFSIKKKEIKEAFLAVKRENFIPEKNKEYAYYDEAISIGYGQTISQPSTIAIMLEMLDLKPGMKVLEIGSGSGYVLALMSKIVGQDGKVYGIEIIKELAEQCKKNLLKEGIKNIEIINEDGSKGLKEKAPFDRIIISCACPFVPKPLFEQLNENGKIVAPIGDEFQQIMQCIIKNKNNPLITTFEGLIFQFVPMKGKISTDYKSFQKPHI